MPADPSLTVLVATESRADVDAIRDVLSPRCNVIWTESGTRTLAALREAVPDVVIFDTGFGDVDCRALSERLASTPATQSTSLIALVRRDDPNAESRAIADGAADTLFKPIDPPVLGARVEARLALRSSRAVVDAPRRDDVAFLPDRDGAEQLLDAECRRSARDRRSLAALLVEIDDLDLLAHDRGNTEAEACARAVARCIRRACLRGGDVAARSGDGQFVVLLPRADESGAQAVAERIRRTVAESSIDNSSSSVAETATVSIGVAVMRPLPGDRSIAILELAAARLDEARREGKNRWVGDATRPTPVDAADATVGAARSVRGSILVVDDAPINADVLTGMLSTTECDVRVALNGHDALAAVRMEPPDLVLLDISMPDMDGYEVCRRLKADHASANIPVIFISALDEPMDKVLAFEVGGADYVQKPFQPAEVIARIAYQLEITRLQADMRAANARLLELDALKATITAMLVHDLRSPLTIVQMVLDSIVESAETEPETIPDLASTASASVTKIIGLVSDMLDVYRSDATGKSFPLHPLDVSGALTRAFEFARVAARYGEIRLELDVEPHLPLIMGNEEKLDRALTNLLSNAIKFTPRGGTITLSANARAERGQRPRLRIAVADTGTGIPEADLPSVFDPYRQAKSDRQAKGVGLGLAIVKRIVDAHHGTIAVDSEVGRGTRFTIEIESAPSPTA